MADKLWRLDEYIVCLDLYLRRGAIGAHDDEAKNVAKLIGRSPSAIAYRLGNFQFVDPNKTGPGLDGGAKRCQPIWNALAGRPELVREVAKIIGDLQDHSSD